MKNWIPYVVAAVLGVGVGVVALWPQAPKEKPAKVEKIKKESEKLGKIVNMGADGTDLNRREGETRTPNEIVEEAIANPPPPPGTLRPQNEGELRQAARLERPFNRHTAYTASFWNQAARLLGSANSELSQECSAMLRYVRDQGNTDEIDAPAIIAREQALLKKIRATGIQDPQLDGILTYLEQSGQAVLDGTDPTAVPKPGKGGVAAP